MFRTLVALSVISLSLAACEYGLTEQDRALLMETRRLAEDARNQSAAAAADAAQARAAAAQAAAEAQAAGHRAGKMFEQSQSK